MIVGVCVFRSDDVVCVCVCFVVMTLCVCVS
jgi:hypothetical protein